MDYIGIIIFIVIVVSNIIGAINKGKKKTQFPPHEPTPTGENMPTTFEDLIKQAQEKARRIQEQKEFGNEPSETRQPVPAAQRPGMERLPDRRVLQDEESYQPTVSKQPGARERERMFEREKTPPPASAQPAAQQRTPKPVKKKKYKTPVKKPRAKLTGTLDMSNRIQAPENDFFADNAIGDISDLEAGKKGKRRSSAIKKKLTQAGEFDFNLRDAVIYQEIMRRKF